MLLGKNLGYIDKDCKNCGRQRVEKFENGYEICEKCHYEQNKDVYILEDDLHYS